MPNASKTLTPFQAFRAKTIGTGRLSKQDAISAGRLFQKEERASGDFMLKNVTYDPIPNFQAPAKVSIVTQSRPFEEWPIARASVEIQKYVYGRKVSEVPDPKRMTSKESHTKWFEETGVSDCGYRYVQGLNKILNGAVNRYHGVLVKAGNRSKKKRERVDRINESRKYRGLPEITYDPEEAVTDEVTGLLIHPPGINKSIYCYKGCSPVPYVRSKHPEVRLPADYGGYNQDPSAPLAVGIPNRLAIPKGQPGHVPEWQRGQLSTKKHRRMRQWWSVKNLRPKPGRTVKSPEEAVALQARAAKARATGAMLAVICIGEDWVVVDLRGLLRNVHWRDLPREELTLKGLLALFTGDPVIDPIRGTVTFLYKSDVLGIVSIRTVKGKKSKECLERLSQKQEVGLVAIDLGQTHPVAAGVSRVGRDAEGKLQSTKLDHFGLSRELLDEVAAYRRRHDAMEAHFRAETLLCLTEEQREEIAKVRASSPETTMKSLCGKLGLNSEELPWDRMGSYTSYISDLFVKNGGDPAVVHFTHKNKKGKEVTRKMDDFMWSKDRPRISPETNKAHLDAHWALKRQSEVFQKLSRSKEQFARRCANYVIREARRITKCSTVVIVLEDLNVLFFHGSGKRPVGWVNYFLPKQENRWLMQATHKAFSDLAPHHGMSVLEVCPQRTSITCLACKLSDKTSRRGERFVCVGCGEKFHADFEIATGNLTQVAMTGAPMPKPVERPSDAKKPGTARKRKPSKTNKESELRLSVAQEYAAE